MIAWTLGSQGGRHRDTQMSPLQWESRARRAAAPEGPRGWLAPAGLASRDVPVRSSRQALGRRPSINNGCASINLDLAFSFYQPVHSQLSHAAHQTVGV